MKVAKVTGTSGKLWKILIPSAAILVAVIGGRLYFPSRQTAPTLTEKDKVVLADFDNKAGDKDWQSEFNQLFDLHPDNTFLVKIAYWLSR